MKKKGISLITLIITIVVVIILAAAVILALGNNNPINSSRVSAVAQTKDNIESGILMYTSSIKAKTLGEFSTKEILINNGNYALVGGLETSITQDEETIALYELSKEMVKEKLNIDLNNPTNNSSWYINEKGKVYLIFNDENIPNYFKENGEIVANLSGFIAVAGATVKTKFTITYDTDGAGDVPSQIKTKGTPITLATAPSKEGYNFGGWKKDNDTIYESGATYEEDEDLSLTAIWNVATRYSVTYNTDGGTEVTNQENIIPGTSVTIAQAPTKTDYRFVNWKDSEENTYNPGDTYVANADLELTAVWARTKFTITYNTNGGSSVSNQTKTENVDIRLALAPTKSGYTFAYWVDEDEVIHAANSNYTENKDLNLTAVWIEAYTISYNTDGGSSVSNQIKQKDVSITLASAPTKEGYSFKFWQDTNGNTYNAESTYTGNENLSLTAIWLNAYTITYNTDGGSTVANQIITENVAIKLASAPSKEGYIFRYWKDEYSSYYNANSEFTSNRNITLTAVWKSGTTFSASEINALGEKAKIDIIGKRVELTSINGWNDWKVFGTDGTNIMLITGDYIPVSILPNGHGFFTRDDYSVSNTTSRSNFLSKLKNATTFAGFKDSAGKIKEARVPKIEDFALSYNSVKHDTYYGTQKIYYKSGSNSGYNIQAGSKYTTSNATVSSDSYIVSDIPTTEKIYGNLWMINDDSKKGWYWLASASSIDNQMLLCVGNESFIAYLKYNANACGLRPIVILNSNVKLKKNINGETVTYTLE